MRVRERRSVRLFALVALCFSLAVFAAAAHVVAQDDSGGNSPDAVALFQKGQDAHEKGQLAAAVELYEKAIHVMPEFPEAELQRGRALLSLGRREEAEKAFRRAVELRSEWTLALADLGSFLVGKGQYEEAEQYLVRALSLNDLNFPAYSALTQLRLKTKAKPEVLRELLERIRSLTGKANPPASIWAARGALEKAIGNHAAALASFDKALTLDPKNQFALSEKAGAAIDAGDTAAATTLLKQIETTAPDSAGTKVLRARLLFANGKIDEAVVLLSSIENATPDIEAVREKMLLAGSQNVEELKTRLKADPSDAVILGRLCSLLRSDSPAEALEMCRRASAADPNNINPAIGYGAALVQAKMYDEAVVLLQRLETIAPDNVTLRANLATALFQLKRFAEAKAEYRWITEKQPTSPIAFYFLAITHDHLAEYLDAMANYQQFLRLADAEKNKLEIEKVNLRLPALDKQIKENRGKRSKRS